MEEIENNVTEDIEYIRDVFGPANDQEAIDYIENVFKAFFNYIYNNKASLEDLVEDINEGK